MDYKDLSMRIDQSIDRYVKACMECIYDQTIDVLDGKNSDHLKKSERDLKFIFNYLSEAVYFNNEDLFIDFSIWLNTLFINIGLGENVFLDTYQCLEKVLKDNFNQKEKDYLVNLVKTAKKEGLDQKSEIDSFIGKDNPDQEYAKQYLNLLLENKKSEASKLITNNVYKEIGVKNIYLNIFQPIQREVGRLWHQNEVSVAQEHYISSVTQLIMSQLYPYFLSTGGTKGNIVTTAIGSELHEIGIRMVADLLEVEGYDTIHLGANTPNQAIIETLKNHKSNILALSVTLPIHLKKLNELIDTIRSNNDLSSLKIIVGGYVFNRNPKLWKKLDVDGHGIDAEDAINKVNMMVGGK